MSSAENTYLVEPKQTPITPADTLVNYSSTVGMCLFNVTMLHWNYLLIWVLWVCFPMASQGKLWNSLATITFNKRYKEHVWCCLCKRCVLHLLRNRWVADLNGLPSLPQEKKTKKKKTMAYCQQRTESHYFTIDNTNTIVVYELTPWTHTDVD